LPRACSEAQNFTNSLSTFPLFSQRLAALESTQNTSYNTRAVISGRNGVVNLRNILCDDSNWKVIDTLNLCHDT
jgi:hypothetical protein